MRLVIFHRVCQKGSFFSVLPEAKPIFTGRLLFNFGIFGSIAIIQCALRQRASCPCC